jgi:zinc protease
MSIVRRLFMLGLSGAVAVAAAPGAARVAHAERRIPQPDAAAKVFPHPVHTRTLANGLVVLVVPIRGSGLASVRTIVRTGSRDEFEAGHTGFAHFFEHMMFRGTKRFPEHEREKINRSIGASTNAYTTDDRTVYQYDIAAEDLERVMDLESDRFMNLEYTKEQFQTEAGAVYGEYRKNRASPFFQMEEAIVDKAFDKHTYGHTTMGYEKDIAAMPTMLAYSKTFFSRYYRPDNSVLLVTGDVDAEATLALAEKYWGAWKKGYKAPKVQKEPAQTKERRVDVAYQGKTLPMIAFAYKSAAYAPDDVDYVSSLVLAELAFGKTSPLYKQLVLDQGLVQELISYPGTARDPGLFYVFAIVADPAKVDAVQAAMETAVAKAKDELADPARVAAVVSHMRYDFLLKLDTSESTAEELATVIALTGGLDAVDRFYTTLARVTPETVRASAQRLLDARRRTVGILREKTP